MVRAADVRPSSDRVLEILEDRDAVRADPNRCQDLVGIVRPWPPAPGQSAIVYPRGVDFPPELEKAAQLDASAIMDALAISKAELNELRLLGRLRWAIDFVRGGGCLHPQAPDEVQGPLQEFDDDAGDARATALPPACHHLYAVEIIGVGTKVGISRTPTKRVATHAYAARSHGRRVGRLWVSVPHVEARRNEQALVGKSSSEYLRRSFDRVMEAIEKLPMTRAAVAALLTLALFLPACLYAPVEPRPVSLPATLHFAPGVDAETRALMMEAAADWNDAVGRDVLLVEDDGRGDGVWVYPPEGAYFGSHPDVRGAGSLVGGGVYQLMLRAGLRDGGELITALHEAGHVLVDGGKGWHSADPHSVMFERYPVRVDAAGNSLPAEMSITAEDVALVLARMPKAGGK